MQAIPQTYELDACSNLLCLVTRFYSYENIYIPLDNQVNTNNGHQVVSILSIYSLICTYFTKISPTHSWEELDSLYAAIYAQERQVR